MVSLASAGVSKKLRQSMRAADLFLDRLRLESV